MFSQGKVHQYSPDHIHTRIYPALRYFRGPRQNFIRLLCITSMSMHQIRKSQCYVHGAGGTGCAEGPLRGAGEGRTRASLYGRVMI